MNKEFVIKTRS